MFDIVEFADIEVFSYFKILKDVFVVMEGEPCCVKKTQRFVSMGLKVSIIDEIQDAAYSADDSWVGGTSKDCKKNLLHVFVFSSSPLCR